MNDMLVTLGEWQMDIKAVREHLYGAPTPRERERWHAVWLLAQGWSAAQVAAALERDAHTIGAWIADFEAQGPTGLTFEQSGGAPPPSSQSSRRS